MKFKIGDKVKFLNESGGGVVSKIISNTMVNVSVEDGFEIPYLTSDLVLVEKGGSHAEGLFHEEFKVEEEPKDGDEVENKVSYPGPANIRNIKHAKEPLGIYIAFLPKDQKFLITGLMDIYLINHTPYDILFSLYLKNKKGLFEGFDYSSVEPESSVLLESIERDQFEEWREGIVQVLYHQEESDQVLLPVHSSFKLKQSKLNNENSYVENEFFDGLAFIVNLNELTQHQKARTISEQKNTIEEKAVEQKPEALIDRHQTLPKIAEVDLHIGELLDNISGMDSRDMFAFQKKYFRECLDSAIENNYKKVTFIHGVGNGRLKNAIIEILKQYEDIENQSASIAKYGVGAIDVLIKPWK